MAYFLLLMAIRRVKRKAYEASAIGGGIVKRIIGLEVITKLTDACMAASIIAKYLLMPWRAVRCMLCRGSEAGDSISSYSQSGLLVRINAIKEKERRRGPSITGLFNQCLYHFLPPRHQSLGGSNK